MSYNDRDGHRKRRPRQRQKKASCTDATHACRLQLVDGRQPHYGQQVGHPVEHVRRCLQRVDQGAGVERVRIDRSRAQLERCGH